MKDNVNLYVNNEVGLLRTVILGIAYEFGGTPLASDCYDPKSLESVNSGTFPNETDLISEMENFCLALESYDVQVIRPINISGVNQIYARDIAFVIEDKLFLPNIIEDRSQELEALKGLFDSFDQRQVVKMPDHVRIEGGDVILKDDHIFIGYSKEEDFNEFKVARTNRAGVDFIQNIFPNKKVICYELKKSDIDPRSSALHLDCCFQPIGDKGAIICQAGFKNREDFDSLVKMFNADNLILIDSDAMYNMNSNIFSISNKVIISQPEFVDLNDQLKRQGFTVVEVAYSQVSKMGGLFRCSTMPLNRE